MAEQCHLGAPGGGGVRQRVQIVFYTVHVTMRIENHRLIKGRKAIQRLQRTVIAVAGHGVHPQMGEKGQCLFQIPQAVPQKDHGIHVVLLFVQNALNGVTRAVAVAQDQ